MNYDKLKNSIPDQVIAELDDVRTKYNINTPLRLAHFLAQCGHESMQFKVKFENLNYSSSALKAVFGKYFSNDELANQYQRQPEKIASRVYANRMDNGDEASGDGWKYRGRGYIQLTGKANYTKFSLSIGEDVISNPDLVAEKYPLQSAAWFWESNGLNEIADKGASEKVVTEVTRRVNGGTIGLEDRIKHFKEYHELLLG